MDSPCIRMCTLNQDEICIGCGRRLEDIMAWTSYSNVQREQITKQASALKNKINKILPTDH